VILGRGGFLAGAQAKVAMIAKTKERVNNAAKRPINARYN
jgi:hypothetical protein